MSASRDWVSWLRRRASYARRYVHPRAVRVSPGSCPLCGRTVYVRFFEGDFGVRCARCGSARNTIAIVAAIVRHARSAVRGAVLLNSQRGPFFDWVTHEAGSVVTTTYVEGSAPGAMVNGARHEDLQALTFGDARFDAFLNQEIYEHVVDDARAFAEAHRVLKPGGFLIFTVPLADGQDKTIERACVRDGVIVHLTEPEYHDEPSGGRILAFRSYGTDVADRLRAAGFASAWVEDARTPLGSLAVGRPVVIAHKA